MRPVRGAHRRTFPGAITTVALLAGLAVATPAAVEAQDAPPGDRSRVTLGPRLELAYAFDAGTVVGALGLFGEAAVGTAREGKVSLTGAVSQFVFFEGDGATPWVFEGGAAWASADRRVLLDISAGVVDPEEGDSESAFRFAIGREYGIEPGRALRLQLALRLLGGDETTFGLVGSYSFQPFG